MPDALRSALHVSGLPTGATQARVPSAAVPGGGTHTDGLHYVRWLALRTGGLSTRDTLSLSFLQPPAPPQAPSSSGMGPSKTMKVPPGHRWAGKE